MLTNAYTYINTYTHGYKYICISKHVHTTTQTHTQSRCLTLLLRSGYNKAVRREQKPNQQPQLITDWPVHYDDFTINY